MIKYVKYLINYNNDVFKQYYSSGYRYILRKKQQQTKLRFS